MKLLTLKDLADRWGEEYNTVKQWNHRGRATLSSTSDEGVIKVTVPFPQPDVILSGRPGWTEETIRNMEAQDGGIGTGGESPAATG